MRYARGTLLAYMLLHETAIRYRLIAIDVACSTCIMKQGCPEFVPASFCLALTKLLRDLCFKIQHTVSHGAIISQAGGEGGAWRRLAKCLWGLRLVDHCPFRRTLVCDLGAGVQNIKATTTRASDSRAVPGTHIVDSLARRREQGRGYYWLQRGITKRCSRCREGCKAKGPGKKGGKSKGPVSTTTFDSTATACPAVSEVQEPCLCIPRRISWPHG